MEDKCKDCTNDKGCINCEGGNMHEVKKKEPEGALKELLDNIDVVEYEKTKQEMLKETPNEEFERFVKAYWEKETDNIISFYDRYAGLVDGVRWQKVNLWKDAQGDDLPEIDREVIVFTQTERQYPKVAIAHTMPLGDWKQFDGNRYYLERNGEVGWSLPDVKWWLDCKMPYKEGGE